MSMFSQFSTPKPAPETPGLAAQRSAESHPLDALTGGAFSAQTSSERAACLREWLATDPEVEALQQVFKELSGKDKGAAKLLREKLDEIKRSKTQASIAQDWAEKAQALLGLPKLNLADALAWQRDAAKAGAPLSKDPLVGLKTQLAERVRGIEDLQHRVQVQREAAVLLAQRIEVLSTKPWRDALATQTALSADVPNWQQEAQALTADVCWPSVDLKFPSLLESSQAQLALVWDAFRGAMAQAVAASEDVNAALPQVRVWADELRVARGEVVQAPGKPAKPKVDPEVRAHAVAMVREALSKLELEVAEGHGKASAGAANGLRSALREFGSLIDERLDKRAHSALSAAGELEGWQRWRADQLREELVAKAESLLKRPEGQAIGGRKIQENLRQLREQWKLTDQGGIPNHGLWKRFDEACNDAHKVVEVWLEKLKLESAENKAQRLALIAELKAWAQANQTALDDDWKGFARVLHQFGETWREAGHIGEKVFAELQPQWKEAMDEALAPLKALQKQSLTVRHALIEEARVMGVDPLLRIDALKALQQRWQHEAQSVPLDRRQEQKLWDAFRKPIDEAFELRSAERANAEKALGERDRVVMQASKSLQAANASGDVQRIKAAMAELDAALHGQAQAQAELVAKAQVATNDQANTMVAKSDDTQELAHNESSTDALNDSESPGTPTAEPTPAPSPAPRKPVIAMRGDDRPGMKKEVPAAPMRAGKSGERGERPSRTGGRDAPGQGYAGGRGAARDARPARGEQVEAQRLGDAAYRAQRDALEQAQFALRKLAAQAHGEALTQLLSAWEKRDADSVPSAQDFGSRMSPATRSAWAKSLEQAAATGQTTALLRLEMAAEVPTPAEFLSDRRMLQLQLLTKRNDPAPAQTVAKDVADVLSHAFDAGQARRLQNVLKVLLKP